MMHAVVLPDGKVSLPPELRKALDLHPGTVLEMRNEAGKIIAWKKIRSGADKPGTTFSFTLPGEAVTVEQVRAAIEDDDE